LRPCRAPDAGRPGRCGHRRRRGYPVRQRAVRLQCAAAGLGAALPPVRRRTRRAFPRRGRRLRPARAAARRRPGARLACRLWRIQRRPPHVFAASGRPGRTAGDGGCAGARGPGAGRHRLPEPARHGDPGQRQRRGRRGGRAVPRYPAREFDQGLDRPHPGRGRHRRDRLLPAGTGAGAAARHPQQHRARPGVRPADPLRQCPRRHRPCDEQRLRLRRQQLFAGVLTRMTTTLTAAIEGIGLWAPGVPSWEAFVGLQRGEAAPEGAPARPAPALLPATLPSVFASTCGELAITDNMCATLASAPTEISPTRFHNSVHNAAAGYWTIGTGATEPATAISAGEATFAMGLVEALAQLEAGAPAVLLVAYDGAAVGPLHDVLGSEGLLGMALALARPGGNDRLQLRLDPDAGAA